MADDELSLPSQIFRISAAFAGLFGFIYLGWYFGTVTFVIALVLVFLLLFTVAIALAPKAKPKSLEEKLKELGPEDYIKYQKQTAQIAEIREAQKTHVPAEMLVLQAKIAKAERAQAEAQQADEDPQGEEADPELLVLGFYEEVWGRLWKHYETSPFTTEDVERLGNTPKDANDALAYLKDRGALKTVAVRTFVLTSEPKRLY